MSNQTNNIPAVAQSSHVVWQGSLQYEHGVAFLILLLMWWLPRANSFRPKPQQEPPPPIAFVVGTPVVSSLESLSPPPSLISSEDEEETKSQTSSESEPQVEGTEAERQRFLIAKRGDEVVAKKSLSAYLAWRQEHQRISSNLEIGMTDDNDLNDWNMAAATAMKARGDGDSLADSSSSRTFFLPRIARVHYIRGSDACDRDGFRIIHVIPGQIDDRLAKLTTYALAIALYLDAKLDPDSRETTTVLVDVRGGQGWPNTHPLRLVPFIKDTIQLLLQMFPERLHRCLLYPLPPATLWIWNLIRKCIDPKTAQKIRILTGEARIISDPPYSQMEEHIDSDIVHMLESVRRAAFR